MTLRIFRYLFFLLSFFFIVGEVFSQNEIVHIYGQLRDDATKKKLDDCKVTVFKNGVQADLINTGNSGKYDLKLNLGYTYDIKFSKDGFLQKIIRLDTRNIPEEERYGGFDMNVPGTLFPDREGFNTDLLKEPVAIAKYFPNEDGLKFDEGYSKEKIAMIAAEHKRLDDLAKNFDKLKKQFDDFLKEGDKKMSESKYADAMSKYQSALGIFPKDEGAKQKYNDAKARFDAENANKEFETQYKQLMADADKAFLNKEYLDAKKKYQEASLMKKDEKAPKEGIYASDQALKELELRKEYDALIADADKKFANKDYATSIEKYREASAKFKNEPYPKDQIVKAELAIKAMLDDEATRLAKRKSYDSKMEQANGYYQADNLEKAISTYKEASFILPDETLPGEKIAEIEKILADRKKMAETIAVVNNDNSKQKEYDELIKLADELFIANKLSDSRVKYVAALDIDNKAKWPKSRIDRIDLLLKKQNISAQNSRHKAVDDSLMTIRLAAMDELAQRRELLDKKRQEQADSRRQAQEEKRLEVLEKATKQNKEKKWTSVADAGAEDEVEQYYRDAKSKEDAARNNEIRQQVMEHQSFHTRNVDSQSQVIAQRVDEIAVEREAVAEMENKGDMRYHSRVNITDQEKKNQEKNNTDTRRSADTRMLNNQKEIEAKQKLNDDITKNDRVRAGKIAENERLKTQTNKQNADKERHGDVLRKDNQYDIQKAQEEQQDVTFRGEIVRKQSESEVSSKIKNQQRSEQDKSSAAYERLKNTSVAKTEEKKKSNEVGEKSYGSTTSRANEIEKQKAELELQKQEREVAEAQRHFEKRNEVNNVKNNLGDASQLNSGDELAYSVSENSYKLGNKMITERTVTSGNKVDIYKKVVSKTAIYYFKNGQSITETIWKLETLNK